MKRVFKKILFPILSLLLFVALWFGNLKPFLASRALSAKNFEKVFKLDTFVSYEAVKSLAKITKEEKDKEALLLALEHIDEEINKRPNDIKLRIHAVYLYFLAGDMDRAERMAEKAVRLAPERGDVAKLLEQIREIRRSYEEERDL